MYPLNKPKPLQCLLSLRFSKWLWSKSPALELDFGGGLLFIQASKNLLFLFLVPYRVHLGWWCHQKYCPQLGDDRTAFNAADFVVTRLEQKVPEVRSFRLHFPPSSSALVCSQLISPIQKSSGLANVAMGEPAPNNVYRCLP